MVSLVPPENNPYLVFNVIFSVNTDRTPNSLVMIWLFTIFFMRYLVYFKIKVFGVSLDFCFKLDIINLCLLVDDFFDNEKQVVTIILSPEMGPLKQSRMIVYGFPSFFDKFISFIFYINFFLTFAGVSKYISIILGI